jgi:hypothetical protein
MRHWSIDEIDKLKQLKNIITKEDICKLFPNRTFSSIISKKKKYKIKCKLIPTHKYAWGEEENNIIRNNFLIKNKMEMERLLPNRKYVNIIQQAKKLNIKRNLKRIWNAKDVEFLKNNYDLFSSIELEEKLKRSWTSIKLKAQSLNMDRNEKFSRNSNLPILLNGSNESLYWIGFILADGHIDTMHNRLRVSLSLKDYKHLEKFSKYISTNILKYETKCSVACQDQEIIPKIVDMFEINSRKTYVPPNIKNYNLSNNQWISLICGFIDGDGCIKKQTNRNSAMITIKCHSSWKENLSFMEYKLYEILLNGNSSKLTKINNCGYSQVNFTKNILINKLKEYMLSLNIPFLERKWSRIDLNHHSKYDIAEQTKSKIKVLLDEGNTILNISKILNYSYAGIYRIVKKYFFNN